MEPTEQSSVNAAGKASQAEPQRPQEGAPNAPAGRDPRFNEFLPDPEEIEQRPLDRTARWVLYLLAALIGIAVLWSIFSEVDLIVTGRGKLITPSANLIVQPLETAVIQSIDVRIGQVVKKGERLAALDPTFVDADLAQLRQRSESLQAHVGRLESELVGQAPAAHRNADSRLQSALHAEKTANYRAKLKHYDETIGKLKAGLVTNARDQEVLAERVASLGDIEAMQARLVRENFGAKLHLLESRERRQEVQRDLDLARNREVELKRELAAAEAERTAFVSEWRQKTMEELVTTKRDQDTANEQLTKADRRTRLITLVSPEDAVVLEIAKRSVGSVVREAEPLFTLVPLNETLEAEVQIDSADIGYVKIGDLAKIKIDAFPFQKHGTATGEVRILSDDAFTRDPNAMRSGAMQTDAYFIGRIKLKDTRLREAGKHFRLLPGMTLGAEIIVGKRSVISYFLYPLIRALDESIREP